MANALDGLMSSSINLFRFLGPLLLLFFVVFVWSPKEKKEREKDHFCVVYVLSFKRHLVGGPQVCNECFVLCKSTSFILCPSFFFSTLLSMSFARLIVGKLRWPNVSYS